MILLYNEILMFLIKYIKLMLLVLIMISKIKKFYINMIKRNELLLKLKIYKKKICFIIIKNFKKMIF